jgi:nucleoside-diphosphate-sugar epimerase
VPRDILIIGCGYVGLPLALQLQARGEKIAGWVRSEASAVELRAQGIEEIVTGSVADEKCWNGLGRKFDAVVHCASSGGGKAEVYREVFLEGVRFINRHQPQAKRLLVSSTSVYGQTSGERVDEQSVAEPAAETSRVLREAEIEAVAGGIIVLRSAGIYGPGRAALFEKLRRGEAVIEGDGMRWVNQIHQLDLVAAIIHLLEVGTSGAIYNAADDEPVSLRDYYSWCSQALHLPMPPSGPANPQRKRGLTNKRVDNHKLRATGWAPRYSTFRDGLAERIAPIV